MEKNKTSLGNIIKTSMNKKTVNLERRCLALESENKLFKFILVRKLDPRLIPKLLLQTKEVAK